MASSYSISSGTGRVELGQDDSSTFYAIQITSTSALDATVTVKLQQSSDDNTYIDLANTSTTIAAGENTVLLETSDFTLNTIYLHVDVGSATAGVLNLFASSKKKEVAETEATISGTADVNVTNSPLSVQEQSPFWKSSNLDAFGRLRVSQLNTQIDLKQIYDELPLFYDIELVGTGNNSYSGTNSETTLTTSASADAAIMQTKQRFNYSSGKSSLMYFTFRNFNTQTNTIKRVGYFNSNSATPFDNQKDGMWLENDNGDIQVVISKNGTENAISQASWDDPLDGTGASGVDLDLGTDTGNYIFFMDYEWLGVGNVRFGFIKNGVYYIAHEIDHILDDGVYMTSPNHSIRYEIRQTGAGSGTFRVICATYATEGGLNSLGAIRSANNGTTNVDANVVGTKYALVGIRLQSAKADTLVDLLQFSILSTTNDNILWELWLNPTVAGTFTYANVTNSSVQVATGSGSGNTVTVTSAQRLYSGYISSNSVGDFNLDNALRLGTNIDGSRDAFVLTATPLTANADVLGAINWREVS